MYVMGHRLSYGGQQPQNAARQQKVTPEGGPPNAVAPPEAAGSPKGIFCGGKAQDPDVKILHIPGTSGLLPRIGKPPYGAVGENHYQTAPNQVGENVSIGTVQRHQRNANERGKPCGAALESAFLLAGQGILQNTEKNHACNPPKLRHIKNLRRF